METTAQKLRRYLHSSSIVVAPGCYDAISARVIEQAGFQMAYMSGLCVAASIGYPDVGLISWTDMVRRAETIANNLTIPLLVDADSGYGGPANIAEAVRAFERAGAAGIHIEDQPFPKKCAALPGKSLISPEQMCANIRIALEARRNPDFVIIARTDAMAVNGLDDAIMRAKRYEQAGADATLIMSVAAEQDMVKINASLEKPTLVMMLEKKRPLIAAEKLQEIGYPIVAYPLSLIQGQVHVQRKLAASLLADGTTANVLGDMASIDDINQVMSLSDVNRLEKNATDYLANVASDAKNWVKPKAAI